MDAVVFGGDIACGPFPEETLALVRSIEGAHIVRGNCERESVLDWMRELPVTVSLDGVQYCHSTPSDDMPIVTAETPIEALDDGGHRPGGRYLRADPLSPFRLEAGALPGLPRGGVGLLPGGARHEARRARRPRGGDRDRPGVTRVPCLRRDQARDAVDPGAERGRRGRRDPGVPAAPAPRRARLHRRGGPARAGGRRRSHRPGRDAEASIFVGAALLLSFADRLGGLLGPDDFGRMAADASDGSRRGLDTPG